MCFWSLLCTNLNVHCVDLESIGSLVILATSLTMDCIRPGSQRTECHVSDCLLCLGLSCCTGKTLKSINLFPEERVSRVMFYTLDVIYVSIKLYCATRGIQRHICVYFISIMHWESIDILHFVLQILHSFILAHRQSGSKPDIYNWGSMSCHVIMFL